MLYLFSDMQAFQQFLIIYALLLAGGFWYNQDKIVQVVSEKYNANRWWYSVGDEIVVFGFTAEIDGQDMVKLNGVHGHVVFLPTNTKNLSVELGDGHMYSVMKTNVKRAIKKSCSHGCNHNH